MVTCRFCLFRLYAAALTVRLSLPRFQVDAAVAGVVGRSRAVCQGSAAAAGLDIKLFVAVLFCHIASLTTLCSLKTKQEEVKSSAAALRSREVVWPDVGLFLFSFSLFYPHLICAVLPPFSGLRSRQALLLTGSDC